MTIPVGVINEEFVLEPVNAPIGSEALLRPGWALQA